MVLIPEACCAEVYLTTDAGETWAARGPKDFDVTQIVPDHKVPGIAWAVAMPTVAKAGEDLRFASPVVMRTEDLGVNWTVLTSYKGPDPFCVAVDPGNSEVVYVGATFGRIEKSADGGKTWTLLTLKDFCKKRDGTTADVQDNVHDVCVRGDRVVAAVNFAQDRGCVALSEDSGKSWTLIDEEYRPACALAGGRIFLADKYARGVISNDAGKTWSMIREIPDDWLYPFYGHGTFSVSPDQKEIVFSSPFETRSSVEGGEWRIWPASAQDAYAESLAWCRQRRVAIFQHMHPRDAEHRHFREINKRTLRVLDPAGEWVPIAVPDGKTPRAIATSADGGAAWLIAR